jgi:hypothetical protein
MRQACQALQIEYLRSTPGGFPLKLDRGATFFGALSAISVKLSFISVFDRYRAPRGIAFLYATTIRQLMAPPPAPKKRSIGFVIDEK